MQDPLPLVSVCVPTRDEAGQIDALLDHLRALPGRWELLVADGGSADGTLESARVHLAQPLVPLVPSSKRTPTV